ncbi:hypothetical protein FQZ97_1038310 [compost metagenome]
MSGWEVSYMLCRRRLRPGKRTGHTRSSDDVLRGLFTELARKSAGRQGHARHGAPGLRRFVCRPVRPWGFRRGARAIPDPVQPAARRPGADGPRRGGLALAAGQGRTDHGGDSPG